MNENTRLSQLSQQFGGSIQLPIPVLVLAGVVLLALLIGALAPGAGLAIVAVGALVAVIVDFMAWQHAEFGPESAASREPRTSPAPAAPAAEQEPRGAAQTVEYP